MTYGRWLQPENERTVEDAAVSHLAELVRGDCSLSEGPLIRPSGTFSPRGEGLHSASPGFAEISRRVRNATARMVSDPEGLTPDATPRDHST